MSARRPITEQPFRYWFAVSVPAAGVDDDLSDALAHAADRAETVLQEERGYEATVWRAAAPNRAEVLREAADALDESKTLRDLTDDHMHDVNAAANELRRMADEAAEKATPTDEPTPADLTIYRASHDSIVMGLYTTATEARAHCVAEERRAWMKGTGLVFDWVVDGEDGVAELVTVGEDGETETVTGYVVTALTVASAYDPEADA